MTWGATPDEWAHWSLLTTPDLTADLLPVVSDTTATISPRSGIRALGKTPSTFNREGHAVGIAEWTQRRSTARQVTAWSSDDRHGICLQTRLVRALDIDVDHDQAAEIEEAFEEAVGVVLPRRSRGNSAKRLLAFILPGDLRKRYFRTAHGLVELLASGQQCIVAGTHTSGARYEWDGGPPDTFAEIGIEDLDRAWQRIEQRFGTGEGHVVRIGRLRARGDSFDARDDVAAYLVEQGLVLGEGRDGALYVDCPWKAGHSSDSGITEAAWFPAGTGGFERGHYRCLHASCAARSDDEFLEAAGCGASSDFEALPPIVAPEADERPPMRVLDPKDALLLAKSTYRGAFHVDGQPTLVRTNSQWFEHKGAAYAERGDEAIRNGAWRFLGGCQKNDKGGFPVKFNPTQAQVNATLDALKSFAEVEGAAAPSWLPGWTNGPDAREIAPLTDGLLHIPTRTLLAHTPGFFAVNALPFAWGDGNGAAIEWLRFLDQVWGDDADAIATLQEMFGYLLTPDTSQQKMFLLVGPKRSGKGTIGRVLSALIGSANTVSPTLTQMTGEFGLEPFIGKLVATIPDARTGPGINTQAVVEKLLMLSGEDAITVNRKGKAMWTGQLGARVVIMTNEVPRLGDASGALPGRFVTMAMRHSFYGKEDLGLTARLMKEMPAIFRWALDGRDRLAARGHFLQPESGREAHDELFELGNPMAVFVGEDCDLVADGIEPVAVLFEAWRDWCSANGQMAGASSSFSRALTTAFPQLKRCQPRSEGEQLRSLAGIRIKQRIREKLLIQQAC